MGFSELLNKKRKVLKALVEELGKTFPYVSVLGTDVRASVYRADKKSAVARDGSGENGYVVKMHDGRAFFEYSLDRIENGADIPTLASHIIKSVGIDDSLRERMIKTTEVRTKNVIHFGE